MPARDDAFTILINAPLARVWTVLSDEFDRVGEWATPVRDSVALPDPADPARPELPGPGRVCRTNLPGVRSVTETITAHSTDDHTFTYRGSGLPSWLGQPENTWFAEAIDDHTTQAGFRPRVEYQGIGRLVRPVIDFVGRRAARTVLDDLKHYVETGQPSPRKLSAKAKARH